MNTLNMLLSENFLSIFTSFYIQDQGSSEATEAVGTNTSIKSIFREQQKPGGCQSSHCVAAFKNVTVEFPELQP